MAANCYFNGASYPNNEMTKMYIITIDKSCSIVKEAILVKASFLIRLSCPLRDNSNKEVLIFY